MIRLSIALLFACVTSAAALEVGVGRTVITPDGPIWMSGYASRSAPSDGVVHDLWAKALAFRDDTGAVSVILTTDLLGVTAPLSAETGNLVAERLGIPRERLMLTSSHTHCGPVIRGNLTSMYDLDEEQARRVREYTEALPGKFFSAIEMAVNDLAPATLHWSIGHTDFAKNRRAYTANEPGFGFNPIGPVDHDVPVLVARRADGSTKAVLFGYACHNTTLDFYQICGDYAGFAQVYLEDNLDDAMALFVSGCGGDQNPLPRRSLTLAETYGDALGKAVIAAMEADAANVEGPVRAVYDEIPLRLSPAPSREELERQQTEGNVYVQRRAADLLKTLDEKGALPETYPYPIQMFQFSDDLQITALAGEVVVDYSLRIKHEFDARKQFVIAYANDVMAYIPSLRILREGGYEGHGAMVYYGLHGPWEPSVEEDIMAAVWRMSGERELIDLTRVDAVEARRPLLIAHRGGVVTESIPECSAAAIHAAATAGFDLVELDIQESKDGEPIVFHDRTLQDACGVDGAIADLDAKAIEALRFTKNGEPVMHLEDALRLCADERLGVMLDIKAGSSDGFFRRIVGLLQRFELPRATLCINGADAVRVGLGQDVMLTAADDQEPAEEGHYNAFWFGLASELTAEKIEELQARGLLVIPAVNTFRYDEADHRERAAADIARLREAGVDGFQIDSVYLNAFADLTSVEAASAP